MHPALKQQLETFKELNPITHGNKKRTVTNSFSGALSQTCAGLPRDVSRLGARPHAANFLLKIQQ